MSFTFKTSFNYNEDEVKSHHNITMTDEQDNMKMYCYNYKECNNDSADVVKQTRGVIFKNGKVFQYAFPYATDVDDVSTLDLEKTKFFNAYEGCILRVFYVDGKRYITTNRKLNAKFSKWSSRVSFGDIFEHAIGEELLKYHMEHYANVQSVFMLRNTKDNRIVCREPVDGEDEYYFLGTYDNDGVFTFYTGESNINNVRFNQAEELKFTSTAEIQEYVDNINTALFSGVVGFTESGIFKIINKTYKQLYALRGNEASVMFRYVQIRQDENMKEVKDKDYDSIMTNFKALYSDKMIAFDNYEKIIRDAAVFIHNAYMDRFIKKMHVVVKPEEFNVIKMCHSWFMANRMTNKVTEQVVLSMINKQNAITLNHIIRFQKERTKNGIGQTADVEPEPETVVV